MVSIEVADDRPRFPDPIVLGGILPVKVTLDTSVQHVKAGTPLRPSPAGAWVPAPNFGAELFVGTPGWGGEEIHAYVGISLDSGRKQFQAGHWYRIVDVDETGTCTFVEVKDDEIMMVDSQKFMAVSPKQILLTK